MNLKNLITFIRETTNLKNLIRETTNLRNFMKEHELENKATKGSKLVEIANQLELTDFNIYIRTDKLNK